MTYLRERAIEILREKRSRLLQRADGRPLPVPMELGAGFAAMGCACFDEARAWAETPLAAPRPVGQRHGPAHRLPRAGSPLLPGTRGLGRRAHAENLRHHPAADPRGRRAPDFPTGARIGRWPTPPRGSSSRSCSRISAGTTPRAIPRHGPGLELPPLGDRHGQQPGLGRAARARAARPSAALRAPRYRACRRRPASAPGGVRPLPDARSPFPRARLRSGRAVRRIAVPGGRPRGQRDSPERRSRASPFPKTSVSRKAKPS